MTVLTIGSGHRDFRDFLNPKSRARIAAYGTLADRSYIIAFTRPGFKTQTLENNVVVFPTNSRSRWLAPMHAMRLGKKVLAGILAGEPVVISAQDPFESGVVAWLLRCRFPQARLQLQVHTDIFSPYFWRERWENLFRVWLAKFLLPRADCIRAVSQRICRSFVSRGIDSGKITVLPVWSSPLDISPIARDKENLRVLVVSRLEREKGVGDSIIGFSDLIQRGGKGHLTIVGDGGQRNKLGVLVEKLGVEKSVTFSGWQQDVAPYYAAADVLLSTALYEGWGLAAWDALQAGVPVVMTDVGLAGEVALHNVNGLIVPVGDTEQIGSALFRLSRDSQLLTRLGESSQLMRPAYSDYLDRYGIALRSCLHRSPESVL
ncbi:MAG: hypothetical protein A3C11_02280 [Candidatus Sungbacteria bacterium RIFCSPHIGHO2_02_FULL_49_12]|uniref:Glycosyl transferase family 1 domain-containing protein n=1 Tax=Candidatus Sungbacteria bacterium RIFCSPHIGHO2_02_FULL_49_12 TaxID=1802271 RepID=A0A1G2KPN6_9BACT|nr:MAG: hypothetical protein A3C11_02280 [Candidatus Sungbacteria bacterium RIFCSPHIGHO2_02_FULL_49_12]